MKTLEEDLSNIDVMPVHKDVYWVDKRGKKKLIHTLSNGYLNNIKKMFRNVSSNPEVEEVLYELKRRKQKEKISQIKYKIRMRDIKK